jgi:uncharacterized protein YceK
MKCVNGFTLLLAVLFLNGCASYIAHKIVSPNNQNLESDLLELHIVNTLCDDDGRCIKALSVAIPPPIQVVYKLRWTLQWVMTI